MSLKRGSVVKVIKGKASDNMEEKVTVEWPCLAGRTLDIAQLYSHGHMLRSFPSER